MKLITTGCSFAGPTTHPHNDEESWELQLIKRLNLKNEQTLRLGLGGCSLDYIYRSIIHGVIDNLNQELVVVVGWTSIQRWEHFTDEFGKCIAKPPTKNTVLYRYNAQPFYLPTLRDEKEYKQHLLNFTTFQEHMRKLNMIITLAGFLKSHNIKYLFFNAFDPLDGWKKGTGYYDKSETGPDCPILDKLTNYVKNHTNFLKQIQIELGAKEGHLEDVISGNFDGDDKTYPHTKKEYFTSDGWHPSVLGHKEWSKVLYSHLNKKYGIK